MALSPAENLLELQFFVIAVSVPILLLSALVQQQAADRSGARQSQSHYRSVVEDQTDLICRLLPDGTCTFVNGAYCRYLGREATELVGRNSFMFIPPGDEHLSIDFLHRSRPSIRRRRASTRCPRPEAMSAGSSGSTAACSIRTAGCSSTRRSAGTLPSGSAPRRSTASWKRRRAWRKRCARPTGARTSSSRCSRHELRNPLAPIGTALEIMRRGPRPVTRRPWARDVIGRQMRQMTRLVDDLLDVSRITRGKIRLVKENVDLSEVVAQAVETSRPLIEARGQTLRVSVPPTPLKVYGDFVRLSQVVANLLNNAAKYTDPGGQLELSLHRTSNTRSSRSGMMASGSRRRCFRVSSTCSPRPTARRRLAGRARHRPHAGQPTGGVARRRGRGVE